MENLEARIRNSNIYLLFLVAITSGVALQQLHVTGLLWFISYIATLYSVGALVLLGVSLLASFLIKVYAKTMEKAAANPSTVDDIINKLKN